MKYPYSHDKNCMKTALYIYAISFHIHENARINKTVKNKSSPITNFIAISPILKTKKKTNKRQYSHEKAK